MAEKQQDLHRGSRMQTETSRSEATRPASAEPAVARKPQRWVSMFTRAPAGCDDSFVGEAEQARSRALLLAVSETVVYSGRCYGLTGCLIETIQRDSTSVDLCCAHMPDGTPTFCSRPSKSRNWHTSWQALATRRLTPIRCEGASQAFQPRLCQGSAHDGRATSVQSRVVAFEATEQGHSISASGEA